MVSVDDGSRFARAATGHHDEGVSWFHLEAELQRTFTRLIDDLRCPCCLEMSSLQVMGESLVENHHCVSALPLVDNQIEQSWRCGEVQRNEFEHDFIVW